MAAIVYLRAVIALLVLLIGPVNCADNKPELPSLLDATLDQLRYGLDSGRFTSVDLTRAYLARIKEVSDDLRPVIEINPDALTIAARMDSERKQNRTTPGPLHGVPVLIKDNIATRDNMNTTAGSYALAGAVPKEESTMARKLREAGALLLGKTNLSQWSMFRSYNTSSGWTSIGGQTKGAYFADHDPSGSSSGSGVATSLGLAWATLGTETAGSLISPGNVNNVVAVKPSVGLTSRYMVVPISEHQDTVGPMARTVKDAAYLLEAIAGPDSKDKYTSASPFKSGKTPKYVAACREDGLRGKRIGIPRHLKDIPPEFLAPQVMSVFRSALQTLRDAGAVLVEDVEMPGEANLLDAPTEVIMEGDFVVNLRQYLSNLEKNPNGITNLQQLKDFTEKHPKEGFPSRDTQVWQGSLDLGFDNTSPEFRDLHGQLTYDSGPLGVLGALKNHSLDAIVVPTDAMLGSPAVAGSPVITVPMGKRSNDTAIERNPSFGLTSTAPNLPFGISFAGKMFGEETLIEIAYAFEQKTKARQTVQPYIKPRTELIDIIRSRCRRVVKF
ncbi:glutamyl-tRNA(Gln) amidotransferase subunit A [Moelleriella libera RCEF 2490]|uniref:Glutamyl-tRNA(Gln) amidotransferase subunit A n=1 Tax=Moelleriella libera RCEF 2490 TaxID=1081109 RepID=A0A166UQA5_9HYPO|nr:glutamyl-tRNA(Gln) amidotransferase subunit A [Moelleriella libera RCEF 2490]